MLFTVGFIDAFEVLFATGLGEAFVVAAKVDVEHTEKMEQIEKIAHKESNKTRERAFFIYLST